MTHTTRWGEQNSPLLITDEIVAAVPAADAVTWMLEALRLRAAGTLSSPPRVYAALGDLGRVVMTAGMGDGYYGYRVYDTLPTSSGQQVVVAHDAETGQVVAVHVGNALGALRTGALGGAAASLLMAPGPVEVGLVGAGRQAWTQLAALAAVLDIARVRVHSRSPDARDVFAARVVEELGLVTEPVDTAREAVRGAGMVVLATNSATPVIEVGWLDEDVLVTTLGPKQVHRAEFPLDLVSGAAQVVTDSPDQLRAYQPAALVAEAGHADRVVDLAEIAAGHVPTLTTGRRVYLSVGLSGTEVHLLNRIAGGSLPPSFTP